MTSSRPWLVARIDGPRFDEEAELRRARYRARFLSWALGRRIAPPRGNLDGAGDHWIHKPLRWADTGEPVTTSEEP